MIRLLRLVVLLPLCLGVSLGLAEQSAPAQSLPQTAIASGDLWQLLGSLLIVVALIFALAWLVRRTGAVGMIGGQHMKVLATMSVGPRERVLLVDVAGQQMLLGSAPGRVSQLHVFDEPVVNASTASPSDFASKMKQFMHTDKSS